MSSKLEELGFSHPIVAEDNKALLEDFGPRARDDYRDSKRKLLTWLLTKGQDPFNRDGYAPETIRKSHYKIERTYRWIWQDAGRYCWRFEPDRANEYLDYLRRFEDVADPQVVEYEKAIKLLFKYWSHTTDSDIDWSYDRELEQSYSGERDYFKKSELRALYEASLSYNTLSIPDTRKGRDELRGVLAQRFDKPSAAITDEDFERANSWKIPSIIGVSNDLGLRPREIEVAKTSWMFPEDEVVRIPADESIKSDSAWNCGLSSTTAKALSRWMAQRESYTIYDDTKTLWLNETGTRYNNQSVNYLLNRLMDDAGIVEHGRNLTWYSIRHGVATMWAEEEGVAKAREQLRHEKPETTMTYIHSNQETQSAAANGKWE